MINKRVKTTAELRQKAMKLFDVSEQTVFNAILFDPKRGNTDTARRIRSYLIQNGGVVMVEQPEMETIHDSDGKMRQHFTNGGVIEVDKETGNAAIYFGGERIASFDNIYVWQLELLQSETSKLKASAVGNFADPTFVERWKRGLAVCWKEQMLANERHRAN